MHTHEAKATHTTHEPVAESVQQAHLSGIRTTQRVVQRVTFDQLTHPVGPRMAAKHVRNGQTLYRFKPITGGQSEIESDENMRAHKYNAQQTGRIVGRRPADARKTPNTILNVSVADMASHLKNDFAGEEAKSGDLKNTRNYKFASAVAHDTIMAFGGVERNGTAEIQVNTVGSDLRFDHLEKTNPETKLNPNELGKDHWLVKKASFTPANWAEIKQARDTGIGEGQAAANAATAAANA